MKFLEENLESILYKTPQFKVRERGLYCFNHQLLLRQCQVGSYGVVDLLGIDIKYDEYKNRSLTLTIYELKKEQINVNTLMQAARYLTGIDDYLSGINLCRTNLVFKIVLIGRTIEQAGDFVFLLNTSQSFTAFTYEYSFDGIRFTDHSGYKYDNSGFKKKEYSVLKGLLQKIFSGM